MILEAWEFIEEVLLIDHCDKCNYPVGPDWEYKDYSRSIVVCPQCKMEYNENDMIEQEV